MTTFIHRLLVVNHGGWPYLKNCKFVYTSNEGLRYMKSGSYRTFHVSKEKWGQPYALAFKSERFVLSLETPQIFSDTEYEELWV